ncbi:unnamed protein product, partial [Protopolystoma xenopodis]
YPRVRVKTPECVQPPRRSPGQGLFPTSFVVSATIPLDAGLVSESSGAHVKTCVTSAGATHVTHAKLDSFNSSITFSLPSSCAVLYRCCHTRLRSPYRNCASTCPCSRLRVLKPISPGEENSATYVI